MVDPSGSVLEYIQNEGVVGLICEAMEFNPENKELVDLGVDALLMFSTENDLRYAMDLIAKSRMEAQSYADEVAAEAVSLNYFCICCFFQIYNVRIDKINFCILIFFALFFSKFTHQNKRDDLMVACRVWEV